MLEHSASGGRCTAGVSERDPKRERAGSEDDVWCASDDLGLKGRIRW